MLIPFERIQAYCKGVGIEIKGILHIGAHECEELVDYCRAGIKPENIYWVEGNSTLVEKMKAKGVLNIFDGLLSDKKEEVIFHITNNGQSSSILPLKTHLKHYPWITVEKEERKETNTLENLIEEKNIPIQECNFWNLDIQGAELKALKGGENFLRWAEIIYSEVNEEELYEGCARLEEIKDFLKEHGFSMVTAKMEKQGWGDALFVKLK